MSKEELPQRDQEASEDPRAKPWPDGADWKGRPDYKDPAWRKYRDIMRQRTKEIAEYEAKKQSEVGIYFGVWIDPGPSYSRCSVAERNDGRKFCLLAPGDDGLPGSGKCCTSKEWCGCIWRPIIEGIDDGKHALWVKGGKKAAQELLRSELQKKQESEDGVLQISKDPEIEAAPQKRKPFWKKILGL